MNDSGCHLRAWVSAVLVALVMLLSGCATLQPRGPAPASSALTDVDDTPLARIAHRAALGHDPAHSGFRSLPEGEYAFDARIALARRAQKSLDVQYYLIQNDAIGLSFLRELRDAAMRGVRVRLLVDDLYAAGEDELFTGLAAYPNVAVRIFNPLPMRTGSFNRRLLLSLHEFGRINHRMHNKLFVADNSLAICGGRNIGNEYFMRSDAANFIDLDVLSSGPVVREMSAVFDRYWNSEQVYPIGDLVRPAPEPAAARERFNALVQDAAPDIRLFPRGVLGATPLSVQLADDRIEQRFAAAQVVADSPGKVGGLPPGSIDGTVTQKVLGLFAGSQDSVQIISPYFIPGEMGLEMMRKAGATQENGRVTLVTNGIGATDEPLVYAAYARYRLDLLRAGVRIHELSPTFARTAGRLGTFGRSFGRLHAKVAVIDRRWVFIGSMNLDARSARANTEMGLVIDSREIAEGATALFHDSLLPSAFRLRLAADGQTIEWLEPVADGPPVVRSDEPDAAPWWQRLKLWLLAPLVGEDLL